jgi:hypothetical protein
MMGVVAGHDRTEHLRNMNLASCYYTYPMGRKAIDNVDFIFIIINCGRPVEKVVILSRV